MTFRSISRFVQSSVHSVVARMQSAHDECATPSRSSYQRDIRYVFKLNTWILGSIGIWPVAIRGIGRYASEIAIAVCNLALSFAIVPFILYLIYEEKNLYIRLKLLGLLAFCFVAMIKYFILVIRRPKILRCIEYVNNDWWQVGVVTFKSDRELMLKYAASGRNLTIIGATFMYTSGIIYHAILPFCSEHKVGNHTYRPLVYPSYSELYQYEISPLYEIIYVAHCMCGYTIYSVTAGTCGLAAVFSAHACGQIQMIMTRLKNLLDGKGFEQISDIPQRIAFIVKSHIRVMRFAVIVEEVLQEVCLVEFTSSICTICLLEYYCILSWQEDDTVGLATYFLLFVSFCFNVYILCYIGELLMEKSTQIGSICCMINWYELPPRTARDLILIIAISNHPIKISAGRMIDLSLITFGNVLKTSVAYLSFLRTLVV